MSLDESVTQRTTARLFGATLAVAGAATVVAAPKIAAATAQNAASVPDTRVVRALGARQLVQGVVTAMQPSAEVLGWGSAVDASHAVSMLPVIAGWAKFRRPAAISAALATISAVVGATLAKRLG